MYGQLKKPMMKIRMTTRSVLPDSPNEWSGITPARTNANSSSGKARNASIVRLMMVSIQPPKYPATTPRNTPRTTESIVAKNAMISEIREP
jgi:hypothetical protein